MEQWRQEALGDAISSVEHFFDEIVQAIIDNSGDAPTDITDRQYSDSYHHESHIDKSYRLLEAAQLLEDLDEFEETDSGLWEGQMPRDAISTQAAYTYGNAVASMFSDIMGDINSSINDAVGSTIFWDLESEMNSVGKSRKRGVKEWRPGVKPVTEEEIEAAEVDFQKRLKNNVAIVVKEQLESVR